MKKYLSLAAAVLAFPVIAVAANTLWEYYSEAGLPLPPVAERKIAATRCGIAGYTGTAEQNIRLLWCLENEPQIGAGNPTTATDWTLASSVAVGDTTFTLSHVNNLRGDAIATSTLPFKVYFGVEAENASNFEIVVCPRSGYDQQNKRFQNCTRGLDFSGNSEASVSGYRRAHPAGASFNQTNVGQFFNLFGGIYDINVWGANNIFGDATGTAPHLQVGTTTDHTPSIYFGDMDTGGRIYRSATSGRIFSCTSISTNCTDLSTGGSGTGLTFANPLTNPAGEVQLATSTNWFSLDGSNRLQGKASSTGGILADANGIAIDETDSFDNLTGAWNFQGRATFTSNFIIGSNYSNASGTAFIQLTDGSVANGLHTHRPVIGDAMASSTGNLTVTHNLGVTPSYIEIRGSALYDSANQFWNHYGTATSTTSERSHSQMNDTDAVYLFAGAGDNSFTTSTVSIVDITDPIVGTTYIVGDLTTLNTTQFVINFTTFDQRVSPYRFIWTVFP